MSGSVLASGTALGGLAIFAAAWLDDKDLPKPVSETLRRFGQTFMVVGGALMIFCSLTKLGSGEGLGRFGAKAITGGHP
jgi:hypothetical protein